LSKGKSGIEYNIKKITEEVTSVNHAIRFVLVVDEKGIPIDTRVITKSFLIKENQAMPLATDMFVLKKLLALYDEIIGENTFTHLVRKHVHD
jgi:hypothetical protein